MVVITLGPGYVDAGALLPVVPFNTTTFRRNIPRILQLPLQPEFVSSKAVQPMAHIWSVIIVPQPTVLEVVPIWATIIQPEVVVVI